MHPRNPAPRSVCFAAVLAGLIGPLHAAPTAPGSTDTPASSAYTNQPTNTGTVFIDSSPFYNSSYYGGGFNGFNYRSSILYYQEYRRAYFYFPPSVPALGESVARERSAAIRTIDRPDLAVPIAPQIAPYVGEIFYPPLATHLHNEDLTRKQYQQLTSYRNQRTELVAALRAKIESLLDADPATRLRELTAFAQEQGPRVDALEEDAEAVRLDLVNGGFFRSGVDWDDWDSNRSWRLGDDLRYESRVDEFKVIRAAAYFYPNLVPAQRRLLLELTQELNEPMREPTADAALDSPGPYLSFSPPTARVRLPLGLPDSLVVKISTYQRDKAVLKEELRSTIYKLDRSYFNFTRKYALNPLADLQAPRLAALETAAEEIRRDLAAIPNPNRPHPVAATGELSKRVESYMHERQAVLRSLQEKMAATQKLFPTARIEFSRIGDGHGIMLIASRKQSKAENQQSDAYQLDLARFNDEQARKYAALARTRAALVGEIKNLSQSAAATSTATNDGSVDAMLRKFATEYADRSHWELYRDYDYAVLEPGLSPGQRRLLFAAALQKLELPIPGGSRQP